MFETKVTKKCCSFGLGCDRCGNQIGENHEVFCLFPSFSPTVSDYEKALKDFIKEQQGTDGDSDANSQ